MRQSLRQLPRVHLFSKEGWSMKHIGRYRLLAAALIAVSGGKAAAFQALPNPVLYLKNTEVYQTGGQSFVRYNYDVLNRDIYPAAMFAAAPNLPPCGLNPNSSRTWVDFYNAQTNQRIYGFCALGTPANLNSIWFALPEGQVPPSYVYIELNDRQTNTKYRSNTTDTVM
jgi:hypothetical protein